MNSDNTGHYIDALSSVYQPAPSAHQATHFFSTDEVYAAIREIDPGAEISKEQIHDAMLQAGYRYQPRSGAIGLNFRWMLRAK